MRRFARCWDLDEFVALTERLPGPEDVVLALVVCRVNARAVDRSIRHLECSLIGMGARNSVVRAFSRCLGARGRCMRVRIASPGRLRAS